MMRNHNHGRHVLWYADPSHICWECFQHFSHPAMVEIHLRDTACTYGRGHFSNAVAIWAPLVLTMFQSIAQALSLPNIEALASFVTSTHSEFLPGIDTPDTKDIEVFWCLQEYQRCSHAAQYLYRPPMCIEVLLQWHMLSGLLSFGSTATAHIHHESAISRWHYHNTYWPGIQAEVYGEGSVQGWP